MILEGQKGKRSGGRGKKGKGEQQITIIEEKENDGEREIERKNESRGRDEGKCMKVIIPSSSFFIPSI